MAKTTIEWTATTGPDGERYAGYTFNPWWGCQKVSPACKFCYAESFDHRTGGSHWGPEGTTARRQMSDKHWRKPLSWDARARDLGVRLKVFCASMADVFEDNPDLAEPRDRLWQLILDTPHLDWLLLTKRPENIAKLAPRVWVTGPTVQAPDGGWPANVWLGVTAENQEEADHRIPILREHFRARRLFVSYEPALELVDWTPHFTPWRCSNCGRRGEEPVAACPTGNLCAGAELKPQIDWLICGAESRGQGPGRPMSLDWVRQARDQAAAHGVAFFYKQAFEGRTKVSRPELDGRRHLESPA